MSRRWRHGNLVPCPAAVPGGGLRPPTRQAGGPRRPGKAPGRVEARGPRTVEGGVIVREAGVGMTNGDNAPLGQEALAFLAGGGEMGRRIRAFDWSASALGPIG